jgi:hypothetical protein
MFALGLGTVAVALTSDMRLWTIYLWVIAVGAKVIAFAIRYVVFRILVTTRIRALGH